MKTKLTLTIEGGVTHRAKTLARQRGKSLSQLVENLLTREVRDSEPSNHRETFSSRWGGKGTLAEKADPRFRALEAKYGLKLEEEHADLP